MENYFIPAYLLNKPADSLLRQARREKPYIKINSAYHSRNNEIEKLQNVVISAKRNNDDVILILKDIDHTNLLPTEDILFKSIFTAIDKQMHFVLMSGRVKFPYTQIDDVLFYISQIDRLNAFVITKALYDIILAVDYKKYKISILQLINRFVFKKAAVKTTLKAIGSKETLNRFNVIVPFRNVEKYISECCQSILKQDYSNYRIFWVDDCSDDNTIDNLSTQMIDNESFVIQRNTERQYALKNIINVLTNYVFGEHDIIVILDGDDALAHSHVFSLLNDVYASRECLVTYGSFRTINSMRRSFLRYSEREFRELRKAPWKGTHLKTFRYSLFKQYHGLDGDFSHLKNSDGEFFPMTYDIALMFPLLELAGFDRVFHIPDPLYLYRLHQDNDHNVNRHLQFNIEKEIRGKNNIRKPLAEK